MDTQIHKIDDLVKKYQFKSKLFIIKYWGNPTKYSEREAWFYKRYRWGIFKDEISFIFDENRVVEIGVIKYFLWMNISNIFYSEVKTSVI